MVDASNVSIDIALVRKLVASQFPQWKDLLVAPVAYSGWDNRTFHLGEQMLVRIPSAERYASQVEKEYHWLPKLAPFLPLEIPKPLAKGKPAEGYPWNWSVYQWIDGETASIERISDLCQFAMDLAKFLRAFQKIDTLGGPIAGPQNFYRGGSLKVYDTQMRKAIAHFKNKFDADVATAVWEKALFSVWKKPGVWVHGDIAINNLLMKNGKLSAVIDFGQLGVGDPACDLAIAWTLFKGESRTVFRKTLSLDDGTWARGRGWVLWKSLCAPLSGTNVQRVLDEIFADHKRQGHEE